MRVQIELRPQSWWGTNRAIKAPTKFVCIILDFQKIVMLIYVSCEIAEQVTD